MTAVDFATVGSYGQLQEFILFSEKTVKQNIKNGVLTRASVSVLHHFSPAVCWPANSNMFLILHI